MTSRKIEILVGFFVAAAIAAFFMLAMSVSNIGSYGGETYQLIARFDNIGGLKLRSPVAVGGVRIGRVSDIRYNSDTYEAEVVLAIESQYTQFPIDTAASILTSGLLGENFISFEPGAEDDYLKDGDIIDLTQSALILEQIIGQFLYSKADDTETQE